MCWCLLVPGCESRVLWRSGHDDGGFRSMVRWKEQHFRELIESRFWAFEEFHLIVFGLTGSKTSRWLWERSNRGHSHETSWMGQTLALLLEKVHATHAKKGLSWLFPRREFEVVQLAQVNRLIPLRIAVYCISSRQRPCSALSSATDLENKTISRPIMTLPLTPPTLLSTTSTKTFK